MKFTTIIVFFMFLQNPAIAQDLTDFEIFNKQTEVLVISRLLQNSNISYVNQLGETNNFISIQQNNGDLQNLIISNQQGSGNQGYINQIGEAHSHGLFQNGTGNQANLWSTGNSSLTLINQQGNENLVNSYIDNQNLVAKVAFIYQTGNFNKVELALLGNGFLTEGWPKDAFIVQTGNNLDISAKLESFNQPLFIEQQSGPTGGGMKINISNSDFYFPMK